MITKTNRIKCDYCGRFIKYADLVDNTAFNIMITPESDISFEEYKSICKSCTERKKYDKCKGGDKND